MRKTNQVGGGSNSAGPQLLVKKIPLLFCFHWPLSLLCFLPSFPYILKCPEVGIYKKKRFQEKKKENTLSTKLNERKHDLDQEKKKVNKISTKKKRKFYQLTFLFFHKFPALVGDTRSTVGTHQQLVLRIWKNTPVTSHGYSVRSFVQWLKSRTVTDVP